jgi:transcriptional regulator with PAS, ATPase and Fis domain
MADKVLVSWIGRTDLRAGYGETSVGPGPIGQAVQDDSYSSIHLLSDFAADKAESFMEWLAGKTDSRIQLHPIKLSSPTNFGEIYQGAVSVLNEIRGAGAEITYHLSPGTPAMQSVWILLAKTTHPARLIQSSPEAGVEEASIPFDISAEFIPQILQQSDKRISEMAQGIPDTDAEFSRIVHRSAVMKRVIEQAKRVAIHSIPVLIEGESGTGKELMAHAIHRASPRAAQPFVTVNCGAIPPELVESEFFGHEKGSFTGAVKDRQGHFELAHRGTLFLDEIGELPKPIQVKLLRVLQEGEVIRIGSSDPRKIDVRVIAATNRTLIEEVAAGNFREDLFYRLAVAIIKLPPLRERAGDISLLVDRLLEHINLSNTKIGLKNKNLSVSAKNIMLQHRWPGNVRELFNTLQRATVWSDDEVISLEAMREAILDPPKSADNNAIMELPIEDGVKLESLMSQVAAHYLKRALEYTHGNKTHAAKLLGMGSYQTLSNWMDKYGVGNT